MKLRFDRSFAWLASGLLLLELGMGMFVHDRFIRPFVGDALVVVVLIFAVCRTFIKVNHRRVALAVLLFAFAIELGQYLNLVEQLQLQHNRLARIIIGTTFDLSDLLAYTAGITVVMGLDALAGRWRKQAARQADRLAEPHGSRRD